MQASLTLLLLCGIVFFSNYRLKNLSSKVAESVKTMYEDRLVVQDIIFSYGKILSQLEVMDEDHRNPQVMTALSQQLPALNEKYAKTVLTDEEARLHKSFSQKIAELVQDTSGDKRVEFALLHQDLDRLEAIQMEEAKKQMAIINKASGGQEMNFYLETAILVILLIIVQVLVASNTTIQKMAKEDNFNLN